MMIDATTGCRVLVVEDETLIAVVIETTLQALGCEVVGPTSRLDTALQLASDETLDAAILDVSVRGGKIFPVAERLLARGIPFILASGYGDWTLPEHLRDQPRLTKPFSQAELETQIRYLCDKATAQARCAAVATRDDDSGGAWMSGMGNSCLRIKPARATGSSDFPDDPLLSKGV